MVGGCTDRGLLPGLPAPASVTSIPLLRDASRRGARFVFLVSLPLLCEKLNDTAITEYKQPEKSSFTLKNPGTPRRPFDSLVYALDEKRKGYFSGSHQQSVNT